MRLARGAAIILLLFLAITALGGSIPMVLYPGGNSAVMPLSNLRHSPFHSYLIPGLLLFAANALLAFTVLWLVSRRVTHSGLLTAFQGCVLMGWLVAECWLLRTVVWLHYLYAVIAAVLIACGLMMRHEESELSAHHKG